MKDNFRLKIITCIFIFFVLITTAVAQPEGTLLWNTFLGSADLDECQGIAVDSSGNTYVTGCTRATWGSPVRAYRGDDDAFVAKLDKDGALLWNTFLGSYSSDTGWGIAVDSSGNVYVAGSSRAAWGSPVRAHTGLFDDVFVAKLRSDGTLVWNSFEGSAGTDRGRGIAVDGSGNIYTTGYSSRTWGSPVRAFMAYYDAFVYKMDNDGFLLWNTFLGSAGVDLPTGIDRGQGIVVDGSGNIFTSGYSAATWGSPVRAYSGDDDVFVAKLGSNGVLLWNTFLGSADFDQCGGIAVDGSGNTYTLGCSFETWGSPLESHGGMTDSFVAKLDNDGMLVWNTFLGCANSVDGGDIDVDGSGNIYTAGISWVTWGSPVRAYSGNSDVFAAKLDSKGALLWNTFLGCAGIDSRAGIAVDGSGNTYTSGSSEATWGSPVKAHTGNSDVFVAKLEKPIFIYTVRVTILGEGGGCEKVLLKAEEGETVYVRISPDEGYEIDKIFDNGIEVTISNPYVITEIGEDHMVEIYFKKILYPPILSLTGVKKSVRSWLIEKGYSELEISITENESPLSVSAYILYKNINGFWTEINRYTGSGMYTYTDKFFGKDDPVSYKLSALSPEGMVITETPVLNL